MACALPFVYRPMPAAHLGGVGADRDARLRRRALPSSPPTAPAARWWSRRCSTRRSSGPCSTATLFFGETPDCRTALGAGDHHPQRHLRRVPRGAPERLEEPPGAADETRYVAGVYPRIPLLTLVRVCADASRPLRTRCFMLERGAGPSDKRAAPYQVRNRCGRPGAGSGPTTWPRSTTWCRRASKASSRRCIMCPTGRVDARGDRQAPGRGRPHAQTASPSGLRWDVVESLPVSEDIKKQKGDWREHIANYKTEPAKPRRGGHRGRSATTSCRCSTGRGPTCATGSHHGGTCMRFDINRFRRLRHPYPGSARAPPSDYRRGDRRRGGAAVCRR